MINIVIFGPPGAGKGTQGEKLSDKYNLVHLSTGDMFRKHRSLGTELGKLAQSYADKGELVPDEVTINMLAEELKSHADANGFIFDGFPRTTSQAAALDELLKAMNTEISVCLSLEVPTEELVERLRKRGETSGRADDMDEAVIRNRLRVYDENTAPLKDFYAAQGKLVTIDGVGSIEEVFSRLCKAIEQPA